MTSAFSTSVRQIWDQVYSSAGLPFPKSVAAFSALGTTRYRVDFTAHTITTYASSGEVDTSPFPAGHSFTLGKPWNEEGVLNALKQARAGEVTYAQFADAVVASGATDYTAYLDGKKVIYSGANGESWSEWFPGAKPSEK